jgi:hypothetical protein
MDFDDLFNNSWDYDSVLAYNVYNIYGDGIGGFEDNENIIDDIFNGQGRDMTFALVYNLNWN